MQPKSRNNVKPIDIKAVILAGGLGTRLREETEFRPKPMIEIGERPILWHIMKIYSHYGVRDFVICLGYKGEMIKDYFLNYEIRHADITIELNSEKHVEIHSKTDEQNWRVTLVETGHDSQTGARLKRAQKYIDTDPFLLTYGDGVSDIDVSDLLRFHKSHGKIATVTGVQPPSRFGELMTKSKKVVEFGEKRNLSDGGMINGGYMVFDHRVFRYLTEREECVLEKQPLERLAKSGQLMVYRHKGFWQCMDTLRDMNLLNSLWEKKKAPWKIWNHAAV